MMRKFTLSVLLIAGLSLLLSFYPVYRLAGNAILVSFILGCIIPAGISIIGFSIVFWARDKSNRTFMTAVIGIFMVKLLAIGSALVLLKLYTEIHIPALIVTLFLYYVTFMMLQLSYFQRLRKGETAGPAPEAS